MASHATAAVPPGWVDALARAAGPAAPAAAARLAGKVVRGMVAARFRTLAYVATLLVATGLVAGHLIPAGPARAGDPVRPAAQSSAPATRPTSPDKEADLKEVLTVQGRVLDPDGRPFAGAMLSVPFENSRGNAFLDKGRSGPDGRFRFHWRGRSSKIAAMTRSRTSTSPPRRMASASAGARSRPETASPSRMPI